MVVGLLSLSRLSTEAQPFQQMDLNRVVAEALSDLEQKIRLSNATIDVSLLPVIEADPLQMRQLFQNLLGNAIKFQPPDATPRVKISSSQTDSRFIQLLVQDNGIGFDAQHADQLFQPFRRFVGRSEYEGSGMGLAICRKIVERHNGEIIAVSQIDQGATFIVTLPVKQTNHKTFQENP